MFTSILPKIKYPAQFSLLGKILSRLEALHYTNPSSQLTDRTAVAVHFDFF